MVPPNGWTSGAHAIVNVVNKRENYTRVADTRDPVGRAVFFEEQAVVIYTSFSDGSG